MHIALNVTYPLGQKAGMLSRCLEHNTADISTTMKLVMTDDMRYTLHPLFRAIVHGVVSTFILFYAHLCRFYAPKRKKCFIIQLHLLFDGAFQQYPCFSSHWRKMRQF